MTLTLEEWLLILASAIHTKYKKSCDRARTLVYFIARIVFAFHKILTYAFDCLSLPPIYVVVTQHRSNERCALLSKQRPVHCLKQALPSYQLAPCLETDELQRASAEWLLHTRRRSKYRSG